MITFEKKSIMQIIATISHLKFKYFLSLRRNINSLITKPFEMRCAVAPFSLQRSAARETSSQFLITKISFDRRASISLDSLNYRLGYWENKKVILLSRRVSFFTLHHPLKSLILLLGSDLTSKGKYFADKNRRHFSSELSNR